MAGREIRTYLVVNSKLAATVADNEHAHATAAVVERVGQTREQIVLVDDGQALLDVAALGHADDAAVVADVEHAVLLEDRSLHGLHVHRRSRVAHRARLLVELLGEEVDTEVAVLAGVSGSRDADDLARSTLQHHKVADADVVAGDRDGLAGHVVAGTV